MSVRLPAPRRSRWALVTLRGLLVLAVALVVGGGALALHGRATGVGGPVEVVRRYFAALQRGDAAAALAYGDVPAGSRALVDDAALRVQQRFAPLSHLVVLSDRVTGDHAVVQVGYELGFRAAAANIAAAVALHRDGAGWSLDDAAIPTRVAFSAGEQRATIMGRRVPTGRALVFPGALVVRFDSSSLVGALGNDDVTFGTPATTQVDVTLTPAGRRAALARVRTALVACLRNGAALTCPQPDERYLPGSLRGTIEGTLRDLRVTLTSSPVGLVRVDARATAQVSYQRLDFTDQLRTGHGRVELDLHAETVAVSPAADAVRWTS